MSAFAIARVFTFVTLLALMWAGYGLALYALVTLLYVAHERIVHKLP